MCRRRNVRCGGVSAREPSTTGSFSQALTLSGLNTYDVSVTNNRPNIRRTHSAAKLSTSSNAPGYTFEDVTDDMGITDPTEYWITSDFPLQDALAMLTPEDNSYAAGPIQNGQLYYGNSSTADNTNLIEGMYQHSDNLHNWTTNLAQVLTNQLAILAPADDTPTSVYRGITNKTQQSHFRIRWCTFASHKPLRYDIGKLT